MPAVEMVALRDFRFAGREVTKGEKITATPSEERTLRGLKWASPAPKKYSTRAERVEDPPNTKPGQKPRTPRQQGQPGRHRRRDMRAED